MTHGKRGEPNIRGGEKEKSAFFFSLSLPSQSHKSYGKSSSFACVLDYTRARAPSSAAPEMMEIGPRGMMAIIRNRGIACTPRLPISPCPVIRV